MCHCHVPLSGRNRQLNRWLEVHDAFVIERSRAGVALEAIASAFKKRFRLTRSPHSIGVRLRSLGESTRDGWTTKRETARWLGVSDQQIDRWEVAGLLATSAHKTGHWRRITTTDLDAFVIAHAGRLFDPARVRDRRLAALAREAASANSRQEVAS